MGKRFGGKNKDKRSRDEKVSTTEGREGGEENQQQQQKRAYENSFQDRTIIDNARFTEYYKDNIVPSSQWDEMLSAMKQQLPIAFRVSQISGPQKQILGLLEGECFGLPNVPTEIQSPDGTGPSITLSRPQILPFYRPKGNAFHMDLGRRELKRFPQIEKFRQFLILHNTVGNITRQEAVSMIPPLLLDVKPHHVVLDMCAAPGSKTSQLLEGLHFGLPPGEIPTGIVIANDSNPDRAYMLVHQLKRLGSPSFMVTTHEGQTFPTLFAPKTSTITSNESGFRENTLRTREDRSNSYFTAAAIPDLDETGEPLKIPLAPVLFDRILCDVPCGGDGTMRKTPTVWSNWSLSNSYALHPLQLTIAWRALQLLKIGGLMVYSTCSINPIEDEAVVLELLRRSNGSLELVKIQDILPELKHVPGQADWKNFAEIPKRGQNPAQLIELTCLDDIIGLPEDILRKVHPSELSPSLLKKIIEEAKIYAKKRVELFEQHVEKQKNEFSTIELAKENQTKQRELAEAEAKTQGDSTNPTDDKVNTTKPRHNNKKNWKNKKNENRTSDQSVVCGFVRELLRMKTLPGQCNENIHYTTRVLPHQQNTGGFYIALLKKVSQLPSLDESLVPTPQVYSMRYDMFNDIYTYDPAVHAVAPPGEDLLDASRIGQKASMAAMAANASAAVPVPVIEEEKIEKEEEEKEETTIMSDESPSSATTTAVAANAPKKYNPQQAKWNQDPFIPSPQDIYQCLTEVWGVTDKLSLLARNFSKHYLMSKAVQELILCKQNYRLKVVHGGLKAFEQDKFFASVYNNDDVSTSIRLNYPSDKYYRACQDGAPYIENFIKKQKLTVTKEDMLKLLSQSDSTNINDLSQEIKEIILNKENRDSTNMNNIIRGGSMIICYNDKEQGISITISALKRAYSISILVDQEQKDAYKYLLGAEINEATLSVVGDGDEEVQLDIQPVTIITPAAVAGSE